MDKSIDNTELLEWADKNFDIRAINRLPNPVAGTLEIVSKYIQARFSADRKQPRYIVAANTIHEVPNINFEPGKVVFVPDDLISSKQLDRLFTFIDDLGKLDCSDWDAIYGACADYEIPFVSPEESDDKGL